MGRVGRVGQVGRVGGTGLAGAIFMSLPHEKLVAWQRADDLFIDLHRVANRSFPPQERFELSTQLRRAAYSVVANIVEGMARRTPRDRMRFLHIAEASLAEAGYCLHAARRLGYLSDAEYDRLEQRMRMVGAPLAGLRRSLRGRTEEDRSDEDG